MTASELTTAQLEQIIHWNDHNNTLSEAPYTHADLVEIVTGYTADMPLKEMMQEAGV